MMPPMRQSGRSPRRKLAALFTALILAACGGDQGPEVGPPASLTKIGDGQQGTVGTAVAVAPAVVVKDAAGTPVPNVTVFFAVISGDGTRNPASVTSDANGVATLSSWILGNIMGENRLSATVQQQSGSSQQGSVPSAIFTATGNPGPGVTLTKISPDRISTPATSNVDSIVVRVSDQFGNPVAGETVNFSVTAGDGSVAPASRVTLADGRAAARWTIGATIDAVNSVTVTKSGADPVVFTTIASRPVFGIRFPATAIVVDSAAARQPNAVGLDQNGTPIPGASFSYVTRNQFVATVLGDGINGFRSGNTFVVASSTDNPGVVDSARLIVAKVGGPVVLANVPRFDLRTDTTFTVSLVVDMRTSGLTLGAATLQVVWNPAVLTYVGNAEGSAGAGATVNTANAASGSITLALASPAGLAGSVEVRQITFKARTTAGTTGTLGVNVIDLVSGGTFANLVPLTVSGSYPLRLR